MKTWLDGEKVIFNSNSLGIIQIGDIWNLTAGEYLDLVPSGWSPYEVLQELIKEEEVPQHILNTADTFRRVREYISKELSNYIWDNWDMDNQFTWEKNQEEDKEAEKHRQFSRHDTASWAGNNRLESSYFVTKYEKSTVLIRHNGKIILSVVFHSDIQEFKDGALFRRRSYDISEAVKDYTVRRAQTLDSLGSYDLRIVYQD